MSREYVPLRQQPLPLRGIVALVLLFLGGLLIIGLAIETAVREVEAKRNYMRTCIVLEREDRCEELWRWRMPRNETN